MCMNEVALLNGKRSAFDPSPRRTLGGYRRAFISLGVTTRLKAARRPRLSYFEGPLVSVVHFRKPKERNSLCEGFKGKFPLKPSVVCDVIDGLILPFLLLMIPSLFLLSVHQQDVVFSTGSFPWRKRCGFLSR